MMVVDTVIVPQVLVADSDDEVVDHASLLNSFGNDNTNIITPVPRMHSIKPEWDEDVRYEENRVDYPRLYAPGNIGMSGV